MTLDEAIKHAEEVAEKNEKKASWFWGKEGNPNYENCVECAEEHRQLAEWLKDYKRLREQPEKRTKERTETHACDCISRQAAIDAFEKFIHELGIKDEPYNYGEMALSEQNVPPVEPERKTGKWLKVVDEETSNSETWHYECSLCKSRKGWEDCDYFPHCGAKMEVKDNGQS